MSSNVIFRNKKWRAPIIMTEDDWIKFREEWKGQERKWIYNSSSSSHFTSGEAGKNSRRLTGKLDWR